jgi:hypothetical protein
MNISRCCCIPRLHVCCLSRGFRSHRSQSRQPGDYSDAGGCYEAWTILSSSDDYSWGS